MSSRIKWTPELDASLLKDKQNGLRWYTIAKKFDTTTYSVQEHYKRIKPKQTITQHAKVGAVS